MLSCMVEGIGYLSIAAEISFGLPIRDGIRINIFHLISLKGMTIGISGKTFPGVELSSSFVASILHNSSH